MASNSTPAAPQPPALSTTPDQTLSPLEQEVLEEYAKLLDNLNKVRRPPSMITPGLWV